MALRLRRGTDAERQLITPLQGELIFATDTKKLYVGDGATVGGVLVGPTEADQFTELVNDETPQLGGDLDLNGNNITGTGNININGTIQATGDIGLGDDVSDVINVGGLINSSLKPAIDGSYDLGTNLRRWNKLWTEGVTVSGELDASAVSITRLLGADSTVVYDNNTDTLTATTVNATNITGNLTGNVVGGVEGHLRGSVFGEDSTVLIDAINNAIVVKNGTIDGVRIGGDGTTPLQDIDATTITATTGFVGNLQGDVNGNHIGDVISTDAVILVDASAKTITNDKLTLEEDSIFGTTQASAYDTTLNSNEPVVVVGSRTSPGSLLVEGIEVPLTIQGRAAVGAATTLNIQSSRYTGTTKDTMQNGDTIGQILMSGYNGTEHKKAAIFSATMESELNSGNFSSQLQVGVLNEDGLYRQYAFQPDGIFNASAGVKVYNASDAELGAFSVTSGTFGYGSERNSMVVHDGTAFRTVVTNVGVPSGPTATGKAGQVSGDANYMYFCYSDDNWIRVAKDGTWT